MDTQNNLDFKSRDIPGTEKVKKEKFNFKKLLSFKKPTVNKIGVCTAGLVLVSILGGVGTHLYFSPEYQFARTSELLNSSVKKYAKQAKALKKQELEVQKDHEDHEKAKKNWAIQKKDVANKELGKVEKLYVQNGGNYPAQATDLKTEIERLQNIIDGHEVKELALIISTDQHRE